MFNSRWMTALACSAVLGAGAASAADLSRPYTKAPIFAEAYYNWSGFYVGGQLGGSWTNESWVNTANNSIFGDLIPGQGFGQRSSGIFGGGQVGYNWQASNYVFGLEGSIAGMNNRGTVNNTVFAAADDAFNWRTDYMATVTGRVGYAFANNLIYAKGGYAGVHSRLAVLDTAGAFTGSGSATAWHNGWTIGAGWEYGVTQNWIVGLEYDYAAFQTKNYQLAGTAAPLLYTFDAKPRDIQSVVARVSYKFGAPLISRY
jgi:outer membrane immunogenic protein